MKTSFRLSLFGFTFNIGWYRGEVFNLFDLIIGQCLRFDYLSGKKHILFTIFSIQVMKFMVSIHWEN